MSKKYVTVTGNIISHIVIVIVGAENRKLGGMCVPTVGYSGE
jgi:hypothetical protein